MSPASPGAAGGDGDEPSPGADAGRGDSGPIQHVPQGRVRRLRGSGWRPSRMRRVERSPVCPNAGVGWDGTGGGRPTGVQWEFPKWECGPSGNWLSGKALTGVHGKVRHMAVGAKLVLGYATVTKVLEEHP